ncbi:DNA-binding response regulator [Aliidiomarina minuta]|uniref:DNA-binding response regulator n=1 Tax=Aliidiomarina minuta TaxID=880057 RepID=A0A432W3E5_9GAMM|nr:response regulator transcription factor [Aliidiomarina minuta]RUO23858.1 DNA-binding response regulator [Aliidiomarina minuta]
MKILLVEDQNMVRGALAALLRMDNETTVVEACDGQAAMLCLQQEDFDVVLTDIEMPQLSGLELLQHVRQHYACKVVILTTFGRAGYVQRALKLGVDGFLLKDASTESLLRALHDILQGRRVIDPELAMLAIGEQDPLTDKERKALKLAAEGKSTSDIATALFIAEGTARNYLSEAIAKMAASNRIDAARIAQQKGWL